MTANAIDENLAPENPMTERRNPVASRFRQDPCVSLVAAICHCERAHPANLLIDHRCEQNVAGEGHMQFPKNFGS